MDILLTESRAAKFERPKVADEGLHGSKKWGKVFLPKRTQIIWAAEWQKPEVNQGLMTHAPRFCPR
jgi:hypothetical protein